MPELPEVESARAIIGQAALGRVIIDADDRDTYVCRPHRPGDIRAALLGRRLTAAHRRGKSIWCDTSGAEHISADDTGADDASAPGRSANGSSTEGPALGIHLGMSGKVVVADGRGHEIDGGDQWVRGRAKGDYRFARFGLTFADGGVLLLLDPRRLGRVRLDPPVDRLGADAQFITPAQFRAVFGKGTAPVKARLLDQEAISGIGNLLADQILWRAKIHPATRVNELRAPDVDRLLRAVRWAVRSSLAGGGVHVMPLLPFRAEGAGCPRCGAPMSKGTVGGRTTWWCSREQVARELVRR